MNLLLSLGCTSFFCDSLGIFHLQTISKLTPSSVYKCHTGDVALPLWPARLVPRLQMLLQWPPLHTSSHKHVTPKEHHTRNFCPSATCHMSWHGTSSLGFWMDRAKVLQVCKITSTARWCASHHKVYVSLCVPPPPLPPHRMKSEW